MRPQIEARRGMSRRQFVYSLFAATAALGFDGKLASAAPTTAQSSSAETDTIQAPPSVVKTLDLQQGPVTLFQQTVVEADVSPSPILAQEVRAQLGQESPFPVIEFKNPFSGFKQFPLFDSTITADSEVQIDLAMAPKWNQGATEDSSTTIMLDNGRANDDPELRRISVFHYKQTGTLIFMAQAGDNRTFQPISQSSGGFDPVSLTISPDGANVGISSAGNTLVVPLEVPLYSKGNTIRAIVQVGPYSEADISQFAISKTVQRNPIESSSDNSLRSLADKQGILFGSAAYAWRRSYDSRYESILADQFNQLVPGGELMWTAIHPQPDLYDFAQADTMVNFASRHNMKVMGEPLVWGYEPFLPDWLTKGKFSRDQLVSIMQDHIKTTISHFRGNISQWSVVLEAMTPGGYLDNFWFKNIGPDYIRIAYQTARETADPSTILIYDDGKNEVQNAKSDKILTMVQELKTQGLVDAVGMEMHLDINNPPKKEDVIANMRRFGNAGFRVYVIGLDVNIYGAPGTLDERLQKQAQVYRDMLEATLESGYCDGFLTWGFTDANTWLTEPSIEAFNGKGEAPLIFDEDYQPKPAFFALKDTLLKRS